MKQPNSEIIIYKTQDGNYKIDVRLEDETVWLTQAQMAALFNKGRTTITEHIGNIFKESELEENSVCRNFRHTAQDGKSYNTKYQDNQKKLENELNLKEIEEDIKRLRPKLNDK